MAALCLPCTAAVASSAASDSRRINTVSYGMGNSSVPGLPRYVRVLICGGGDNRVLICGGGDNLPRKSKRARNGEGLGPRLGI